MIQPNVRTSNDTANRDELYREIGHRIRAARLKKKLTQETIAATVGLSRTSLTNIEKGRQKLLLHTFVSMAAALGVRVAELLPEESAIPEEIQRQIESELPQEHKMFIARAIIPPLPHESITTTANRHRDQKTAAGKRLRRTSNRR